jgi:uncharacterized damage-inducible protein DinB
MKPLLEANIDCLQQLAATIESLSEADYSRVTGDHGYGIGRHVRHILDHYAALKVSLSTGLLDYDQRQRDNPLEMDSNLALAAVKTYQQWLQTLDLVDAPLQVKSEINVLQSVPMTLPSHLSRELCYLINHTVHHLAYMRLLAVGMGYTIDQTIGLAPATASNLRESEAAAS